MVKSKIEDPVAELVQTFAAYILTGDDSDKIRYLSLHKKYSSRVIKSWKNKFPDWIKVNDKPIEFLVNSLNALGLSPSRNPNFEIPSNAYSFDHISNICFNMWDIKDIDLLVYIFLDEGGNWLSEFHRLFFDENTEKTDELEEDEEKYANVYFSHGACNKEEKIHLMASIDIKCPRTMLNDLAIVFLLFAITEGEGPLFLLDEYGRRRK